MGSVTHQFLKFFRSGGEAQKSAPAQPNLRRRSSGLNEFTRTVRMQDNLCLLDLGSTSPANISYLTGLGHRLYTEDLLTASHDPALRIRTQGGETTFDVDRFIGENLKYENAQFDAVLCWDVPDYLPELLVKPVIARICSMMKPGGLLLAFFHTRDAGPDAPHYRYHMAGNDVLELQPSAAHAGTPAFRLQRVFNNRHIENLFRDFASIKFFLARDHVREVLVVR
jgi:SAM-dependent methyltransferase